MYTAMLDSRVAVGICSTLARHLSRMVFRTISCRALSIWNRSSKLRKRNWKPSDSMVVSWSGWRYSGGACGRNYMDLRGGHEFSMGVYAYSSVWQAYPGVWGDGDIKVFNQNAIFDTSDRRWGRCRVCPLRQTLKKKNGDYFLIVDVPRQHCWWTWHIRCAIAQQKVTIFVSLVYASDDWIVPW